MIGGSTIAAELATIQPWADRAPAITLAERQARIERARAAMVDAGADALLVGAGLSLSYFTGIGWGMIERLVAMVLTPRGKPYIVCPAFEQGSLEAILTLDVDLRLWEEHESPSALVAAILREAGATRLAIDPALPFGMAERVRLAAPSASVLDATPIIDGCRAIKSEPELALMRQAKRMTLEVQRRAARVLAPGIRASAVRGFIDAAHKAIGSGGSTFCIVQFGASTAFPHGLPQDDELREGDMVLIDTGCAVEGYNSDITRSYVFGKADDEQRRIWEIEAEAQRAAFDAVRPGVPCAAIDAAARAVLERHGLGPDYRLPGLPHRTGHGIGLSVHEAPYLVRGDETPLQPGMCFSNEPMIVVPGRFGVRLEDHFHVTDHGARWFTEPSRAIDEPFA
ncbi:MULTISPECIES: Xaa-Pro peptidase family protein [unclassified Novosphingobium]|uniref:M24 family metallopeptidase n=1 Tax=unclassified Novosphingobium TaxID=2644732 RepID=UPI000F601D4F|nr:MULTISPECIES: Xaa-Pro peptidase family protein [unclassified Novosphingobium]MBF5092812.1 aminopeptidase P family protein [Novosphingobium sp. NBM11]RQW44711.1 aminopeptidase P family protein [Novosphingobium sp. LASN5T]